MPAPPITVSPSTATIQVGGTVQLTVDPSGGAKWRCSNCSVALITRHGLVTAIAEGVVIFTATRGNQSAAATITVIAADVPNVPPNAQIRIEQVISIAAPVVFNTDGTLDPDGLLVAYSFDPGDGGPTVIVTNAPPQYIEHLYTVPGTYTAIFTVTDDRGRTASAQVTVEVPDITGTPTGPTAALALTVQAPAGSPVTVSTAGTAAGSSAIIASGVDWGDGSQTTDSAPPAATLQHTYAESGSYQATLTVTDTNGLQNSATITIDIAASPPPLPPSVVLAYQSGADTGSPFVFATAGTSAGLDSYTFTRGDGTSTGTVAGDVPATLSYTYPQAGTYQATLTVVKDGVSASAIATVLVGTPPPPPTPPNASITYQSGFYATDPYVLSTLGTTAGLTSYNMNWGDGPSAPIAGDAPATLQHTYALAGTYTATLTVVSPDGTGVATLQITIAAKPVANQPPIAQLTKQSGVYTTDTHVFSTAGTQDLDGTIVSYVFSRGDGTTTGTVTGPPPATLSHVYFGAGLYTASLTVTDDDGASTTQTIGVQVYAVPPPPSGSRNAYYNALIQRADTFRAYSLRDQNQLKTRNNGGYAQCNTCALNINYIYPNDPDPRKQDAAKLVIPATSFSLPNFLYLPFPAVDGSTYFVTWDIWWGAEFDFGNTGINTYKTIQFAQPSGAGSPCAGQFQWWEIQHRFNAAPGTDIARVTSRSYFTKADPVPQVGTFTVKPERWTRYWALIDRTTPGTAFVSLWVADTQTDAVLITDRFQKVACASLNNIWVEFNTSSDATNGATMPRAVGPLVAYLSNFWAGRNVASPASLLTRPV